MYAQNRSSIFVGALASSALSSLFWLQILNWFVASDALYSAELYLGLLAFSVLSTHLGICSVRHTNHDCARRSWLTRLSATLARSLYGYCQHLCARAGHSAPQRRERISQERQEKRGLTSLVKFRQLPFIQTDCIYDKIATKPLQHSSCQKNSILNTHRLDMNICTCLIANVNQPLVFAFTLPGVVSTWLRGAEIIPANFEYKFTISLCSFCIMRSNSSIS